jgi:hypothetical protein
VTVACPHCNAALNPKGIKPGTFRPKCPKCQKPFEIVVPDDPNGTIRVRRLRQDKPPAAPQGTAPAEPTTAPESKPLDLDEIAARLLAAKTDLDIPVDQRNAPESETGITGDITVPSHMRSPKVQ